jgi:hypothetical protein
MDKTGNGLPIWQDLLREAPEHIKGRIIGYNFSGLYPVELEDRPLEANEKPDDLLIKKNIKEYSSDKLREWVDAKKLELPFDKELLSEWQGQSYTIVKSTGNPMGKRNYSAGKFHTLDAGRMMIAGKTLEQLEHALAEPPPAAAAILDQFVMVG